MHPRIDQWRPAIHEGSTVRQVKGCEVMAIRHTRRGIGSRFDRCDG